MFIKVRLFNAGVSLVQLYHVSTAGIRRYSVWWSGRSLIELKVAAHFKARPLLVLKVAAHFLVRPLLVLKMAGAFRALASR